MAIDRNGCPVTVGTRVRVLEIAEFLKRDIPPDEWQQLQTMVGEVFEVYEIDEYGIASYLTSKSVLSIKRAEGRRPHWIEKWWDAADGQRLSHSLPLDAHEMEVV